MVLVGTVGSRVRAYEVVGDRLSRVKVLKFMVLEKYQCIHYPSRTTITIDYIGFVEWWQRRKLR